MQTRKAIALLLALLMVLSLTACGRKAKEKKAAAAASPTPVPNEAFEVKLNLDNFLDYFYYKEYRADVRDENTSEIDSSTISYGFQLKEQYTAANEEKHKDTMALHFKADGVVMEGSFDINFDDLSHTGLADSIERTSVEETLHFWGKGDRTTWWTFGNYSSSYIMYLENFTVTDVSGSIWLKRAEPKPETAG
ncbi:MAG: hypothetical protein IKD61_01935 [Oscillospiraceae bacterium]|nr:hypothetical protein [Oscillospiraceae bacterium]MBR6353801.1 hypothetical protein [Oscillospiraceae bacterium]